MKTIETQSDGSRRRFSTSSGFWCSTTLRFLDQQRHLDHSVPAQRWLEPAMASVTVLMTRWSSVIAERRAGPAWYGLLGLSLETHSDKCTVQKVRAVNVFPTVTVAVCVPNDEASDQWRNHSERNSTVAIPRTAMACPRQTEPAKFRNTGERTVDTRKTDQGIAKRMVRPESEAMYRHRREVKSLVFANLRPELPGGLGHHRSPNRTISTAS